jgi:glycosyltransferase involved in cell wall biosynthesis
MTTSPQITVLMPAYNAGKYIAEAIASVLGQTFGDFELLIVNDGSTDDTVSIIKSFDDQRIRIVSQSNQGVAAALNTGLRHAHADYIARFDADDICLPHRLQKQYDFLKANPDYILVGSDVDYIIENNDFLFHFKCLAHSHEEILDKLYFYCPFVHPAVMYKKEVVLSVGGYPDAAHNFEDYMLWVAIAGKGKFCNLDEPLVKYRLNPQSVTIDERWRGRRFRELKRKAVINGIISDEEGNELLEIIKRQDVKRIKEGSYHALCGKKFLADNYQPRKARRHVKKAIKVHPLRVDNYLLYMVSFLPKRMITWLHGMSPNKL